MRVFYLLFFSVSVKERSNRDEGVQMKRTALLIIILSSLYFCACGTFGTQSASIKTTTVDRAYHGKYAASTWLAVKFERRLNDALNSGIPPKYAGNFAASTWLTVKFMARLGVTR